MEVKITQDESVNVQLIGRVNPANTEEFLDQLRTLEPQCSGSIVLDCSQLEYICSSGLSALLYLLKQVKGKGGSLKLTHLTPDIYDVFRMTGFSSLFTIEE